MHGFERTIGHVVLHISFFICSFYVYGFGFGEKEKQQKEQSSSLVNLYEVMEYLRWMHAFMIVSIYLRYSLKGPRWSVIERIVRMCSVFVYFIVFLYVQFKLTMFDP